jgi:hypothetical protein
MNSIERPPHFMRRAGQPPEDLDAVLGAFFRSEVPKPWPVQLPVAHDTRRAKGPVQRTSFALSSRLSLAAAVAIFVIGYLTLASWFPLASSDPGANVTPSLGSQGVNRIRKNTVVPPRTGEILEQTSNGGEALLQWDLQVPGRLFMRIEERRPPRR